MWEPRDVFPVIKTATVGELWLVYILTKRRFREKWELVT